MVLCHSRKKFNYVAWKYTFFRNSCGILAPLYAANANCYEFQFMHLEVRVWKITIKS